VSPAAPRSHPLAAAAVALGVALLVGGCSGEEPPPPQAPQGPNASPTTLTVYAASSLKASLTELTHLWEDDSIVHGGSTLAISTDSSAALETKIEQGAPADVFLSADTTNPQKLVDGGFATGPATVFATNRLVIILAPKNPANITSPFDLAKPGVKIVAAGDTVPITTYATQLVQNLAKLPGAPAGFEAAYRANVVTKAEDVRAVITQVLLGQGDAAIVYVSDAKTGGALDTIAIPEGANVVATYAGVVVKASSLQAADQAFLSWLGGPAGQAVLQTYGFLPPPA